MDEKIKELKEKFDPMVYFLYESDSDGFYRRDSMGRYSREYSREYSRDYSNDGQNEEMFTELRRIMNMTPDEKTRQEIKKFISTNKK